MPTSFTAEQAYYFKARPERVFEALTQPKSLVKWFLSKAKVEPAVGGTFSFDWMGGYRMVSTLKKYEKNKTVSFAWVDKLKNGELAKTTALFDVAKKRTGDASKTAPFRIQRPRTFR